MKQKLKQSLPLWENARREREEWKTFQEWRSCERKGESQRKLRELRELVGYRFFFFYVTKHCNFVNIIRVIFNNLCTLLSLPFKSLQFGGIKNEGLELVEIPPNAAPSFFKKLSNKVIKLLSLPLLYSPSFF